MEELNFKINNNDLATLQISSNEVLLERDRHSFNLESLQGESSFLIKVNSRSFVVDLIEKDKKNYVLKVNGKTVRIGIHDELDELLLKLGGDQFSEMQDASVESPMPGKIIQYMVKQGDEVKEGDALFILEAMKMENVVKSPLNGTVKDLGVEEGATVQKGEVIVQF